MRRSMRRSLRRARRSGRARSPLAAMGMMECRHHKRAHTREQAGRRRATGRTWRRKDASMIRMLLVEDHTPVRQALREGLEATGAVRVVAEAGTGRGATAAVEGRAGAEGALV